MILLAKADLPLCFPPVWLALHSPASFQTFPPRRSSSLGLFFSQARLAELPTRFVSILRSHPPSRLLPVFLVLLLILLLEPRSNDFCKRSQVPES